MKSKKIKDIEVGDKVLSPTLGWVTVKEIIPPHIPDRMFKIKFKGKIGSIKCSGNHIWKVYKDGVEDLINTQNLFGLNYQNFNIGVENGPRIKKIKEIKPKMVSCIVVDSNDHLFGVNLNKKDVIFTHNCQFRMGCGRLGQIASMMLFGNTIGTTINGKVPGAGMISSNGEIQNIQYYFTEIDFITDFYKKAGFDKKGRRKFNSNSQEEENTEENDIEQDDSVDTTESFNEGEKEENLEDFFEFSKDVEDIEIEGIKRQFDKTKKQTFE